MTKKESFDLVEDLGKELEKDYGKGIVKSARSLLDETPEIIPVSPNIDIILNGGIPRGTWLSIAGPEKLGKTTTALTVAAYMLAQGDPVCYINAEHRLKRKNLEGIKGLDPYHRNFALVQAEEGHVLSSQECLGAAHRFLHKYKRSLLIFDSVSALVPQSVLTGGMGTETRGLSGRLVSQFCDLCQAIVPLNKAIVIGIVQLYKNTGNTGGETKEKAASRWQYQADIRLRITYAEAWKTGADPDGNGGTEIGKKVHWKCNEAAMGAPGKQCVSYLRYGIGIDKTYELFENAKAAELVEKAGAWYTLTFLDRHKDLTNGKAPPKVQGMEGAYRLLTDNPTWLQALQADMNAFMKGELP